jgi:catechol 2,3-dioxygenase-like lactoylglutathione lyase family enzyme
MLDHVFLTVTDLQRSIAFYEATLSPLGINLRVDFDGKDGPSGHPDLKGFGANGRLYLWLRQGMAHGNAAHIGFVANSRKQVDAAYAAAIAAGATDN